MSISALFVETGGRIIIQKNKLFKYSVLLLILSITVIIWPKHYNFATKEPFIIVTRYSAGLDEYKNMYHKNIAIYDDGKLVLYSDEDSDLNIDDDAPVLRMQLDEEEVEQVKNTIKQKRFWKLPRDVSTPSEDGGFRYVTVNLKSGSKKVGGLNPDNERFDDVFQSAWDLVEGGDYRNWKEEIEEYIEQRYSG